MWEEFVQVILRVDEEDKKMIVELRDRAGILLVCGGEIDLSTLPGINNCVENKLCVIGEEYPENIHSISRLIYKWR